MEFAVIQINSKQYIVKPGQLLRIDRVTTETPVEVIAAGSDASLDLMGQNAEFGVSLEILEDKKDSKILVRRYKSKSRYRKEKSHRQPISVLRVTEMGNGIKNEIKVKAEKLEKPVKTAKSKSTSKKIEK